MPGCRAHAVNRGFVRTVLRGRDGLEVVISPDEAFVPIGERLNPTNKPRLQRAYDEGNWAYVQRDATRQVAAGATVIDVNTGDPHHEIEARKMRDAVRAVQDVVDVPVSIDSYTIDVLLTGLEVARGRPLVNSVPYRGGLHAGVAPGDCRARCLHDRHVHQGRRRHAGDGGRAGRERARAGGQRRRARHMPPTGS